jgi:hypothetical protein
MPGSMANFCIWATQCMQQKKKKAHTDASLADGRPGTRSGPDKKRPQTLLLLYCWIPFTLIGDSRQSELIVLRGRMCWLLVLS